jgi:hypothetical protein
MIWTFGTRRSVDGADTLYAFDTHDPRPAGQYYVVIRPGVYDSHIERRATDVAQSSSYQRAFGSDANMTVGARYEHEGVSDHDNVEQVGVRIETVRRWWLVTPSAEFSESRSRSRARRSSADERVAYRPLAVSRYLPDHLECISCDQRICEAVRRERRRLNGIGNERDRRRRPILSNKQSRRSHVLRGAASDAGGVDRSGLGVHAPRTVLPVDARCAIDVLKRQGVRAEQWRERQVGS